MKTEENEEAKPIQMVIWFVDDHAGRPDVFGPFENCIRAFASNLAGGGGIETVSVVPPKLTMGVPVELAVAMRWLKTFKLPRGVNISGSFERDVEILAYGFSAWEPLQSYLTSNLGGLKSFSFWPHLVFTDVFDGELKTITKSEDIRAQAGYKFAKKHCVSQQIPCIIISSEPTAIDDCDLEWQGDQNLYHFHRSDFLGQGKILGTLEKLKPLLLKRWWIPEFALTVEGRKNSNQASYTVTFRKNGKVVSHVKKVGPGPYIFLYLCVHGSILAQLKGWDKELVGWAKSKCIAVSRLPSTKDLKTGQSVFQDVREFSFLFEKEYWATNKNEIFFVKDSTQRTNNILNVNIKHLDIPFKTCLPLFWNNDDAKNNLKNSMREMLSRKAMEWLEACCTPG